MKRIYLLGDVDTVSALRLAGVDGVVSDTDSVDRDLQELLERGDGAVIVVTRDLAEKIPETIVDVNLNSPESVIIEIPCIDDTRGFGRSIIDYITEALGIAV